MNDTRSHLTLGKRLALLGTALLLVAAGAGASRLAQAKAPDSNPPPRLEVNPAPLQRDGKLTTSFAPVVKQVAPSVVNVFTTTRAKKISQPRSPYPDDPLLRRFFGGDPLGGGERTFRTPRQNGLGSGVIVTKDGYILTNNHVVENADEIKVGLADGREHTAKVVGRDPKTDIAVLKIDAENLAPVTLADSDKIEVGDVVLAVGNPFGIGQTVTMGMVSATGRGGAVGLDYEDFIQTDAAINPGNSGGALVDAEGRLVGINTAILSRTGGHQGIGFAVPANLARSVLDGLVKDGRVVRGFLGVNIQDVTPGLAKEFDLPDGKGALVSEVTPKSPAEKAGLKTGDVILEFNGKAVADSRHLKLQVGQTPPGGQVPVKVLRDGAKKNFEVTLKEFPREEQTARSRAEDKSSSDALDGVTVSDLDPATRHRLRLPRELKGALVARVEEDSASFEAGLREGDVILEINRKPVASAEEAVELSEKIDDKTTLVRVWSRGGSRYVVVDESKAG